MYVSGTIDELLGAQGFEFCLETLPLSAPSRRQSRTLSLSGKAFLPADFFLSAPPAQPVSRTVVNPYDNHFQTTLTEQEKADLMEYLKSI